MLKSDLVDEIQKPEYQEICKKVLRSHWKDLYQELAITILEYDEEKISRIPNRQQARFFLVGILLRMAHSNTSPFYKKLIQPLPAYQPDHEDTEDADKFYKLLEKEHWFDKRMVETYLETGSYRKAQNKLNVHFKYVRKSVKKTVESIKFKMKPIRILLIANEANGLYFHRQKTPHARLQELYPESIELAELWSHTEDGRRYESSVDSMSDERLQEFDIVYYLRQISFKNGKNKPKETIERLHRLGLKVVFDIDDYWVLPAHHRMSDQYKEAGVRKEIEQTLPLVDHVVTTTDHFAERIRYFNPNVTVIPNCIHPKDTQFISRPIENSRLRFGWIGGVYHQRDIQMIEGNFCKLHKDREVRDKYQVCLGGFNYTGPENEYVKIERSLTCNYEFRYSDATYANYLFTYTPTMEHISYDKPYRRLWGKEIHNYGELYNEIDVALAPLEENKFSSCKSELKIVEAGWMSKAVIVSDVHPYSQWIENGVNGVKIKPSRNGIDWYLEMKKLINEPQRAKEMGENLNKTIRKHFDMDKHTERRFELYKSLVG